MIECNWAPAYTLATQTTWTSGIYVVLLTNAQGYKNYMIFVVRDDSRVAPLLYQQSVTTYQAYNNYPNGSGKSLYDFNSFGSVLASTGYKSAAKVSFDRPYLDSGINEDFYSDTGEVNFIRWIERSGYDVTYSTDVDTHTDGAHLLNYRGLLSPGHDEYWSKQMYDNVLAARDAGMNVAFFGANAVYWQIRFEASSSGVANRVIVCYKDYDRDPITDDTLKTVNWRDAPLNRPEQTLVGVMYTPSGPPQNSQGLFPAMVINNSSNWVYAGTGFIDGDTVPGLVGYEADRQWSQYAVPNAVPGTYTLLSRTTWGGGANDVANSSIYQAASGAWVFATGTMSWNWALDSYGHGYNVVDARIQRTTANILDRFIGPDFSVSASPASQMIAPGNPTSYAIGIIPKGGFAAPVTLSVSGLPTGAVGTFSPNPTSSTSSTLSVTTDATTPTGFYTLTVTGVGGSLTRTTTVTLALLTPDFALGSLPSSQSVTPGSSTSYNVTVAPTGGFAGQVALSVGGLPTGATGTFAPNPATASSTLSVTTSSSTPIGNYTLTITGVSGSLTHTTTVSLSVVATPPPPAVVAFDAAAPGASVLSGSSLSWNHTVTTTESNLLLTVGVAVGKSPDTGLSLAVTYNGVPMTSAGLVHSNNRTDGFVQLFYLKAPATGTHAVQVTLTGGTASIEAGSVSFSGVDQTTPVRNIATGVGAGATPTIAVTSAPGDMVVDVMVTGCDGTFTSSQTLRWVNQVNCATAGGNAAQSTAAGAATVAMGYTVPSDWWGMIGVDVVAAGTTGPQPFDFTLGNGGNTSVVQGATVTNTATATLSSGTAEVVTFSVSGLPAGLSASYNPTSCSPTCSTTLSLNADASAVTGTSTITVTGTAGTLIHTTTFGLTVTAPATPNFTLSATPATQTVAPGAPTSYGITISPTGGFTSGVTLSVAGLPTGATGTFAPNPATASSTLSVTTNATTPSGAYTLTITGVSGTLTHTATVGLNVSSGIITVTAPNTAVNWKVTSQQNITFTHNLGVGQPVNIDVSRDGGVSWSPITVLTTTSATTGTYSWVVSGPATTQARIRATSAANSLVSDTSDVNFTITSPTITVTAPNTAVSWRAGDTKSITFSHSLGVGQVVNIDVSRDGGATWALISPFTTTSATSGTYAWVVSGPTTTQARIRVSSALDSTITDIGDVNFTILPRTTVTAPNTAVTWGAGSTRKITWNHNLGLGGLVDIDFSPDNGISWVPLARGVASGAATTGSYTGPMPATPTTQALIRVSPSIDPTLGDVSNVVFTLAAPTVTVTAPNTNVELGIGSAQSLKWTHNLGTLDSVRIELARDGVNYTETSPLRRPTPANTSSTFSWIVTGPATTTARIRVIWPANESVSDISNVSFTIR